MKQFNSIEEIYYFMDEMFTEGFTEEHINKALDIFIRDAEKFTEEDLQKETFSRFVREVGLGIQVYSKEQTFLKIGQFLDWYVVDDKFLWINLELEIMKRDTIFSSKGLVQIMSHFARQQEGTTDFYDFIEHKYMSEKLDDLSLNDLISLGYNYYLVHTGSHAFFKRFAEKILAKINKKTSTYDLLRIIQTFSEIADPFAKLFV